MSRPFSQKAFPHGWHTRLIGRADEAEEQGHRQEEHEIAVVAACENHLDRLTECDIARLSPKPIRMMEGGSPTPLTPLPILTVKNANSLLDLHEM